MDLIERREPVFDVGRVEREHVTHDRGVELVALHARDREQAPIELVEPIDLASDRSLHRLRQLAGDVCGRLREVPPAAVAHDVAPIAEVAQQVHHEQRVTFGLLVDQRDERGWQRVARELELQVAIDVGPIEVIERALDQRVGCLQLPCDRQERVTRDGHVRGPVGDEYENPHAVEPAGQVVQHVDGRRVGPVQILDEEHQRTDARHVLEVGGELALHPFLGRALHVLADVRGRRALGREGASWTYHVGATRFIISTKPPPDVLWSRWSSSSRIGR